jgi:hypothetical protein
MRILVAAAALACAACSSANPAAEKVKLRNYLTEQMRKNGWSGMHTDEDSRARAPTKYAEATKGLVFTIRHSARHDDMNATIVTWVYQDRAARDAAREPFRAIQDDLGKANLVDRSWPLDVEAPELHALMLMESPSMSMANQFQLLFGEVQRHLEDLKEMK